MARVEFGNGMVSTIGELPPVGRKAPDSLLVDENLKSVQLSEITGRKILNIFPSIGTGVCQSQVRAFSKLAGQLGDTKVLNISLDLPFAMIQFCGAEGIENAANYSTFRGDFAVDYGVKFLEGGFEGLCSRSIVVIDAAGIVIYTEQVPATGQEPDYKALLAALDA